MSWDPSSDIALRGSHAPRVGAGESRAEAATRRVESASATAAADEDRPYLLGRAVETLEELAQSREGGTARDRGAVAPPGLQALLGMESLAKDAPKPRTVRRPVEGWWWQCHAWVDFITSTLAEPREQPRRI